MQPPSRGSLEFLEWIYCFRKLDVISIGQTYLFLEPLGGFFLLICSLTCCGIQWQSTPSSWVAEAPTIRRSHPFLLGRSMEARSGCGSASSKSQSSFLCPVLTLFRVILRSQRLLLPLQVVGCGA
jgi:hypothetical protein